MVLGPISRLERNPQCPKGWKNRESDGIGLGIVAALERSDGRKRPEKIAAGAPMRHVSAPITIGSHRAELGGNWRCCDDSGVDFHGCGLFCGPPPKIELLRAFQPVEFLSYCYLCRRRLHGKDIYMYRGEKAFCSVECRYQQIVSDEFQEKCGSEARISSVVSRSPDRLFFMGIAAS